MFDDSTRRRFVTGLGSACVAGLSGCLGGDTGDGSSSGKTGETDGNQTQTATPTDGESLRVSDAARERLDDRLVGLVEADDRSAYADSAELAYDDGRVLVVVELRTGSDLPATPPVNVENRHESLVEGRVAVDDLPALATAEAVEYVRPTRAPTTHGTSPQTGRSGGV